MLLAVLLAVAGCSAPVQADPNIQAKADAFSKQVEREMAAKAKAAAEALLIRVKMPADRPLKVLFAGDTITGGYYASTQAKGFSQLVAASLAKHGEIEEVRAGVTGGKVETLGGLSDIPSGLDLAVLQLGTIEVGQKEDAATFARNYETVLRNMKARSPKVAIVCVSVWQSLGINAAGYDRLIREKCKAQGGQFVDVSALFIDPRSRGPVGVKTWAGVSDAFHPNDAGHKAIADLILKRITFS
jgi:lysophospholipase L1-like esterase